MMTKLSETEFLTLPENPTLSNAFETMIFAIRNQLEGECHILQKVG